MKFSDLQFKSVVSTPARLLRLPDAIAYVGAEVILRELEKHAGLKPYERRNKLTVYDRLEIDQAIDRMRQPA